MPTTLPINVPFPASRPSSPPRHCYRCNNSHTRRWRTGPDGFGTLCNKCGNLYASRKLPLFQDVTNGRLSISPFPNARLVSVTGFQTRYDTTLFTPPSRCLPRDLSNPVVVPIQGGGTITNWSNLCTDQGVDWINRRTDEQVRESDRLRLVTSRAAFSANRSPGSIGVHQFPERDLELRRGIRANRVVSEERIRSGDYAGRYGDHEDEFGGGRGGGRGSELRRAYEGGSGGEYPREEHRRENPESKKALAMELEDEEDQSEEDVDESWSPPRRKKRRRGFARFRGGRVEQDDDCDYVPDISDREEGESSEGSAEPEEPLTPLYVDSCSDTYDEYESSGKEADKNGEGDEDVGNMGRLRKKRRLMRLNELPKAAEEVIVLDEGENDVREAGEGSDAEVVQVPFVESGTEDRVENGISSKRIVVAGKWPEMQSALSNSVDPAGDLVTQEEHLPTTLAVKNAAKNAEDSLLANGQLHFAPNDDGSVDVRCRESIINVDEGTSEANQESEFEITFVSEGIETGCRAVTQGKAGEKIHNGCSRSTGNNEALADGQSTWDESGERERPAKSASYEINDAVKNEMQKVADADSVKKHSCRDKPTDKSAIVSVENTCDPNQGNDEYILAKNFKNEDGDLVVEADEKKTPVIQNYEECDKSGVYATQQSTREDTDNAKTEVVDASIEDKRELTEHGFSGQNKEEVQANRKVKEVFKRVRGGGDLSTDVLGLKDKMMARSDSNIAGHPHPIEHAKVSKRLELKSSFEFEFDTADSGKNIIRRNQKIESKIFSKAIDVGIDQCRCHEITEKDTAADTLQGTHKPDAASTVSRTIKGSSGDASAYHDSAVRQQSVQGFPPLHGNNKPKNVESSLRCANNKMRKSVNELPYARKSISEHCSKYHTKFTTIANELRSEEHSKSIPVQHSMMSFESTKGCRDMKSDSIKNTAGGMEAGSSAKQGPGSDHGSVAPCRELDCTARKTAGVVVGLNEKTVSRNGKPVEKEENIKKHEEVIDRSMSDVVNSSGRVEDGGLNLEGKEDTNVDQSVPKTEHSGSHLTLTKDEKTKAGGTAVRILTSDTDSGKALLVSSRKSNREAETTSKSNTIPIFDNREKDSDAAERVQSRRHVKSADDIETNIEIGGSVDGGQNYHMPIDVVQAIAGTEQVPVSSSLAQFATEENFGRFHSTAVPTPGSQRRANPAEEQIVGVSASQMLNIGQGSRTSSVRGRVHDNSEAAQGEDNACTHNRLNNVQGTEDARQSLFTEEQYLSNSTRAVANLKNSHGNEQKRGTAVQFSERRFDSNADVASSVQRQLLMREAQALGNSRPVHRQRHLGQGSLGTFEPNSHSNQGLLQRAELSSITNIPSMPACLPARLSSEGQQCLSDSQFARKRFVSGASSATVFQRMYSELLAHPRPSAVPNTFLPSENDMEHPMDYQCATVAQSSQFVQDSSLLSPMAVPRTFLDVRSHANTQPGLTTFHNTSMTATNNRSQRMNPHLAIRPSADPQMNSAIAAQSRTIYEADIIEPSVHARNGNQASYNRNRPMWCNGNYVYPPWHSPSAGTFDTVFPYVTNTRGPLSNRAQSCWPHGNPVNAAENPYSQPISTAGGMTRPPPTSMTRQAGSYLNSFLSQNTRFKPHYSHRTTTPYLSSCLSSSKRFQDDHFRLHTMKNFVLNRAAVATGFNAATATSQNSAVHAPNLSATNQATFQVQTVDQNTFVSDTAARAFGSESFSGRNTIERQEDEQQAFLGSQQIEGAQVGRTREHSQMLSVKVECEKQFRRLSVYRGATFAYFKAMVMAAFQTEGDLLLRYLDNEDDYITLSSEGDMKELFIVAQVFQLNPIHMQMSNKA